MTARVFCGKIYGKAGERMTQDELQFFMGNEAALPLYVQLRGELCGRYPETEIRVSKTQITFRERYGYAFVSTRRMGRGCPGVFIIVSFGLGRELRSPRILSASEPYPGRWTHHVCVPCAAGLDSELFGWLAEARAFSLSK